MGKVIKGLAILEMIIGILVGFVGGTGSPGIGIAIAFGSIISGIFIYGFGEIITLLDEIKRDVNEIRLNCKSSQN